MLLIPFWLEYNFGAPAYNKGVSAMLDDGIPISRISS